MRGPDARPLRIMVASPTYRGYSYEWARGVVSLLQMEQAVADRLDRVEFRMAVARGYGGARQMGLMFSAAADQGLDYVLTCEWDHAWDARHVAQVVEAMEFLESMHGRQSVAVGATYPSSSDPERYVIHVEPRDFVELEDRILAAEALRETPTAIRRYVPAVMLPAGFTLWPVTAFAGVDIEERVGLKRLEYWDRLASENCAAVGVRLFVDLSLDVGHVPAAAVTALELAKRRRRT